MAETPGQPRNLTVDEQALWPAVGLISYGTSPKGAICSGTLVTPDLVLTAAHCVSRSGVAFKAQTVTFSAGWRDGTALAVQRGKAIILANGADSAVRSVKSDMALLVLDQPIRPEVVPPMRLHPPAAPDGKVSFIGYRRDGRDVAQISLGCSVLKPQPPAFGLDCHVVSGNSGSAVLWQGPDGWLVSGVIVARGDGRNGVNAYAAIPGDDLRLVIDQHRQASH